MPVLLAVLKILAILLAILLVLLITALLLPLGFSIEYRPSRFRMTAIYDRFGEPSGPIGFGGREFLESLQQRKRKP